MLVLVTPGAKFVVAFDTPGAMLGALVTPGAKFVLVLVTPGAKFLVVFETPGAMDELVVIPRGIFVLGPETPGTTFVVPELSARDKSAPTQIVNIRINETKLVSVKVDIFIL